MYLEKGNRVGIVCCSNAQPLSAKEKLKQLESVLREMGLVSEFSAYLYSKDSVFAGTASQRAHALMEFYEREDIQAIFDISGGDIANEILPALDYEKISQSKKLFWGYSDLTTILNAVYAKTGRASVLYQIKNLVSVHGEMQRQHFRETVMEQKESLLNFAYHWIQGSKLEGVVVGGNIRCFLKLAGTPYWPDLTDKILFLESRGGTQAQMTTYLSCFKQIGVFEKIKGILLGTFTAMEQTAHHPTIEEMVQKVAGNSIPIAKTSEIGHNSNSKAIVIGKKIEKL